MAADNGTNVNGESVVIRISEAGNLSDKVVYEDKLKEYETKKAEDTANGCVVEMEKYDGLVVDADGAKITFIWAVPFGAAHFVSVA